MRIIPFDKKRDDMIFMVLEAKSALGRVSRINDDLPDIQQSCIDKGDMFWLAVDDSSCVIGCIRYSWDSADSAQLRRLYEKRPAKHRFT